MNGVIALILVCLMLMPLMVAVMFLIKTNYKIMDRMKDAECFLAEMQSKQREDSWDKVTIQLELEILGRIVYPQEHKINAILEDIQKIKEQKQVKKQVKK